MIPQQEAHQKDITNQGVDSAEAAGIHNIWGNFPDWAAKYVGCRRGSLHLFAFFLCAEIVFQMRWLF